MFLNLWNESPLLRKEKMCPCRVFFGAGWHLDGRQMFQIKAIYKNTLAQKIEKYEALSRMTIFCKLSHRITISLAKGVTLGEQLF